MMGLLCSLTLPSGVTAPVRLTMPVPERVPLYGYVHSESIPPVAPARMDE